MFLFTFWFAWWFLSVFFALITWKSLSIPLHGVTTLERYIPSCDIQCGSISRQQTKMVPVFVRSVNYLWRMISLVLFWMGTWAWENSKFPTLPLQNKHLPTCDIWSHYPAAYKASLATHSLNDKFENSTLTKKAIFGLAPSYITDFISINHGRSYSLRSPN